MDSPAPTVELFRLTAWPRLLPRFLFGFLLGAFLCAFLGTLGALRRLAIARVGRTVGNEIGRERAGHVGTRGVVLTQEARQRRRRHRLQEPARALVAGIAG